MEVSTVPRKRTSPETIIRKLREAEILISQGRTMRESAKQIGVTEQTYYRWRKAYGGMAPSQATGLSISFNHWTNNVVLP